MESKVRNRKKKLKQIYREWFISIKKILQINWIKESQHWLQGNVFRRGLHLLRRINQIKKFHLQLTTAGMFLEIQGKHYKEWKDALPLSELSAWLFTSVLRIKRLDDVYIRLIILHLFFVFDFFFHAFKTQLIYLHVELRSHWNSVCVRTFIRGFLSFWPIDSSDFLW